MTNEQSLKWYPSGSASYLVLVIVSKELNLVLQEHSRSGARFECKVNDFTAFIAIAWIRGECMHVACGQSGRPEDTSLLLW
jgi:hypothetical protein